MGDGGVNIAQQMVYEIEGHHGGDIRGWHGEQARQAAEQREYERYQEYLNSQEREDG